MIFLVRLYFFQIPICLVKGTHDLYHWKVFHVCLKSELQVSLHFIYQSKAQNLRLILKTDYQHNVVPPEQD